MEGVVVTGIKGHIRASLDVKTRILDDEDLIIRVHGVAEKCIQRYREGGKMLFAGNGGSAADSQHLAAELVSRLQFDRPALSALALSTDTSALTAIGNDYGFEHLFARQLRANGVPGDVFFAISTSGGSVNIIRALEAAKEIGVTTVGLTGASRGPMNELCDHLLAVPSTETALIQEAHIMLGHAICAQIERVLFG